MLLITYSCEHNHSGPVSRNNNHNQAAAVKPTSPETVPVHPEPEPEPEAEEKFVESLEDQFSWFGEMETTSSTVLESSIFSGRSSSGVGDSISSDVAMPFPMGDDDVDDSLFADLGELPECSVVFRHGGGPGLPVDEQPPTTQRRITPWCGATTWDVRRGVLFVCILLGASSAINAGKVSFFSSFLFKLLLFFSKTWLYNKIKFLFHFN